MKALVLPVIAAALLLVACGGANAPTATIQSTSVTPSLTASPVPETIPPTTTPSPAATQEPLNTPAATAIIPTVIVPAPTVPQPPSPLGFTGVAGVAEVGPTCPVQRIDSPCPDRPWQGIVAARTAAGVEVARAQTNAGGAFSMRLPPGTYDILTLTTGILPSPASVRVTVTDGEVTQVQLSLDSGIR